MNLPKLGVLAVAVSMGSIVVGEDERICRWVNLDETRVYQCALIPTAAKAKTTAQREMLPDPTLPLSMQSYSRQSYSQQPYSQPAQEQAVPSKPAYSEPSYSEPALEPAHEEPFRAGLFQA